MSLALATNAAAAARDAAIACRGEPQPARVVAVTALLLTVLQDLTSRPPETLSDAEADFWGCLIESYGDLERIRDRARDEMGAAAVSILREGAV